MSDKPYSVNHWGSHPDDGNDDCYTGDDFATFAEADAAYSKSVTDPGVAYIHLDGPGTHKLRKNPAYDAAKVARENEAYDRACRHECAMEAGMAFGCDGYNDAMGY